MKRWLAVRRWWIVGLTASLVAVRIAIAIGIELFEPAATVNNALTGVAAACDVLGVGSAVAAVIAFVQYGRIFNARVPTE